ncbi:MAG: glycoside hydrolase family 125 protein [Gemmatimonadota bacterium]
MSERGRKDSRTGRDRTVGKAGKAEGALPSRREFLQRAAGLGLAAGGLGLVGGGLLKAVPVSRGRASACDGRPAGRGAVTGRTQFVSRRPPLAERRFVSPAVEERITRVKAEVGDEELAWLFENCFPNTLDTTVEHGTVEGRPDTFVITGDIEAMWLRDSSAQVWPYLPLAVADPALRRLLAGVIHRQTRCILIDPYANAFNRGPTGSRWAKDLTNMKPELHERKWEVDSLCYPIRLAHGYWKATGDASPFDHEWTQAMASVLRTFREQQRVDGPGPYRFQRVTARASDTVAGGGYGNPIRPVGLIVSIFRPSDDATIFPFLVPSNHFAVVSLRQLAEMLRALAEREGEGGTRHRLAAECVALADEVAAALERHAIVEHPDLGHVFAYEVDGFGNRLHMDDANVPSLLALPYLGCCRFQDPLYLNTRAFALGESNPYFFRGRVAEGVGSPHTGADRVWPLALIMRAMTSDSDEEIGRCLAWLKASHAGTGFMHESFHKDDPARFTRGWFAWANTLFGELVLKLHAERPHLLAS